MKKGVMILTMVAMLGCGLPAAGQTRTRQATRRVAKGSTIPVGTQMKIRLETEIDTKKAKSGDTFTATALTPSGYAEATVEGHISEVKQSGKVTGRTEMMLSFDRLRLKSGETIAFGAQVVKIYGESSAKKVDDEGTVSSDSQGKTTAVRTAGGAAVGAVIGAIAGGGKGAAIGAAVGGAAGAGSVLIQGSKKVKLEKGTEILIKVVR